MCLYPDNCRYYNVDTLKETGCCSSNLNTYFRSAAKIPGNLILKIDPVMQTS